MGVRGLVQSWERKAKNLPLTASYEVRLRQHDMARIEALSEMYPGRTADDILAELIRAALDDIETSLPYVAGDRVVAEDEFGDPVFEDAGPSRKFYELTRKHQQAAGR